MIAHSVRDLSAVSAETETNHEAFKRIKRKPLCDENCLLGAVGEAGRSEWWVSAGAISRPANLVKVCVVIPP